MHVGAQETVHRVDPFVEQDSESMALIKSTVLQLAVYNC
jgi:hypothetical protein